MRKALYGGLLGLLIVGVVLLFFSWLGGIFSFRLVPPRIESYEFTPQGALMHFQCLLTGAIAGGATYYTGRRGLGVVLSIGVGYGLGSFFVDQNDKTWETIGAIAMLPLVFAGVLSSLAFAVVRIQEIITVEKET